jgi:hypothetical protein
VLFYLNDIPFRMENVAPYALGGDLSGDYLNWTPEVGTYTIHAIPYSGPTATGEAGIEQTITIEVIEPRINFVPDSFDFTLGLGEEDSAEFNTETSDGSTPPSPVSLTATDDATGEAPTWLAVPSSVNVGTPYPLFVNSTGLAPGSYSATVSGEVLGYVDGTLTVTLTVLPEVTGFTLVDAGTDGDIGPLNDGDVINLALLEANYLNIRANTVPGDVGSVRFDLNGVVNVRTENVVPYALYGDWKGDYFNWSPAVGTYTLTATPFTGVWRTGVAGTPATITFEIINVPVVTGFTLVDADTNTDLMPLEDGAVIDLASLPTQNLNVRAEVMPGQVGSVRFDFNGTTGFRVENVVPYALFGDWKGNYFEWEATPGTYSLSATPFSGSNTGGTAGMAASISFTLQSSN